MNKIDPKNGLQLGTDEHFKTVQAFIMDRAKKWKNLVYRFGVQEIYSRLSETYMKACNTYKPESGKAFTTWFGQYLDSERGMMYREQFFQKAIPADAVVSLDKIIPSSVGKSPVTYQDAVADKSMNPEDKIIYLDRVKAIKQAIKEHKHKEILEMYFYDNINQTEIAQKIKSHQPTVNRIIVNFTKEIAQLRKVV